MSRYDEDPTDRRELRDHGWNLAGELQARIQRTAKSPEEVSALVQGAVERLRGFEEDAHESTRHGMRYSRKPGRHVRKASTIAREFRSESSVRKPGKAKPYFGHESTPEQWAERIRWERAMVRYLRNKGEHTLADGHELAARAYEDMQAERFGGR
jgi:hypothetical protein